MLSKTLKLIIKTKNSCLFLKTNVIYCFPVNDIMLTR